MKTSTPKKIVEEKSILKSMQAIFGLVVIGIVMLFLFFPLAFVAFGFAYFFFKNRNKEIYYYEGNCPKCQNSLKIGGKMKDLDNGAADCKFCKSRVILKNGTYECYD